ncbi:MAG: CPXCG motif-containing cysteine-rich protein [Desulfosporosinus sp.]
MTFTIKCPYCKGRQGIEINLQEYGEGSKYYDCQHCLECFEVKLRANAVKIEGKHEQEKAKHL